MAEEKLVRPLKGVVVVDSTYVLAGTVKEPSKDSNNDFENFL